VYYGPGDQVEEENLMEFRLLYEGNLPPSGNNPHVEDKHEIRRVFHPQLRRLWQVNTNLRAYAGAAFSGAQLPESPTDDQRFDLGIERIGHRWSRAGYNLVPLVIPEFSPQCSIDILLLRPERYEVFGEWGDLDGQVRTILDALKIPKEGNETANAEPSKDEDPLFCLLADDKLVSEVKITADKLLMLPEKWSSERDGAIARLNLLLEDAQGKWKFPEEDRTAFAFARKILERRSETKPNDSFVIVHVRLNHRNARTFDNWLG
jgi:hypothetical protein